MVRPNTAVAAVIPTIPPRREMLIRALASVAEQTYPVSCISVVSDIEKRGAAHTRNDALQAVPDWVGWVAFLDDDDEWLPNHVETLIVPALTGEADYVYSYFTDEHRDPLGHFGKAFDPENPKQTTITTLVRRELAQRAGFRPVPPGMTVEGQKYGEDFQFTLDCLRYGGRVLHVPARTWRWNWHRGNTSGEADRW